jgi:pimeloyl-ACP methyl ester carboxylesterase
VFFLILVAALILAGLVYQALGRLRDRKRYPPPGRMIPVQGSVLHFWEMGRGAPPVILEAGIAGSCLGWSVVQTEIARFTAVCSYDRPGLGWSRGSRYRRTVAQMTAELREVLAQSGLPAPYVLVGHSFGGLLVRAFAARYPELTGAIVLVDPVSVASWTGCSERDRMRLRRGVALSRRGGILARLGVVRATLNLLVTGSRFLPKLIGRTAAGKGAPTMERLIGQVRRMPREYWPVVQAHWSDAKCFSAMANYLQALPDCAGEVQSTEPPAHIPQIILSAETATVGELEERDRWAASGSVSRHVRVAGSGHWIQLEQPQVVIDAVREAVEMARSCCVI